MDGFHLPRCCQAPAAAHGVASVPCHQSLPGTASLGHHHMPAPQLEWHMSAHEVQTKHDLPVHHIFILIHKGAGVEAAFA